jgi:hypothetical protein
MKENSLTSRLGDFTHRLKVDARYISGEAFKSIVKFGLLGFSILYLSEQNGCNDSLRTKSAMEFHSDTNRIKTVVRVSEDWYAMHSNPLVQREVVFSDSSKTVLHYRVAAHMPFKSWIDGEEFKPKPGEQYELTNNNTLVQRIR